LFDKTECWPEEEEEEEARRERCLRIGLSLNAGSSLKWERRDNG
jgi:hypothetical protein